MDSSEVQIDHREVIRTLIELGDHDSLSEAIEIATDWTQNQPQNALAHLYQGDIHNRWQQKDLAKACYEKAAELYAAQGKGIQSLAARKLLLELDHSVSQQPITLPPTPLFSGLNPEVLMRLLDELKRKTFANGEFICLEGDPGDSIYILSRGKVGVLARKGSQELREIAVLDEGSFFGEFAYFTDQKRHASVQAKGSVEVLEIQRGVMDRLRRDHPEVGEVLRSFYEERVIDTLLARSELFGLLKPEERKLLLKEFSSIKMPALAVVLLEGDPGDSFYFIQSGEVEIYQDRGGQKIELARLSPGDFFGELATLNQHRRLATVRTLTDCEFLMLKRERMEPILKRNPVIAETLQRIAQKRLDYSKGKTGSAG